MNVSSHYRSIPRLLVGVGLLFCCVLFSGCRVSQVFAPSLLKDLFGDHLDQFPSVVLDANGDKKINYDFNWDTTTMAGASISNFPSSKKYWRLNAFSFKGQALTKNDWKPMTDRSVTLDNLGTEVLLRFRLELADDKTDLKNREKYNFIVLFHNEP